MVNFENCIALLIQHAQSIKHLASKVSVEQARWKPNPDSWSILEVINHLYDEEREDFRRKLKHLIDGIEGMPVENDPQGWITERQYNQRDLETSIAQFLLERDQSIEWLRSLSNPDWNLALVYEEWQLSAGDLLVSWVAHDLLHIRQLVELKFAYFDGQSNPYDVGYAGKW